MSDGFVELFLDARLLRALGNQGLETPTEVQEAVVPEALAGRDILAHAPTGTGKTLAYLLPMLQFLLENHGRKGGPHAVVLVPTRELARQVFKEAIRFAEFTNLRIASIAGGESYAEQLKRLNHEPDLLIATPGRLQRALEDGTLALFDVDLCVLDEADRMLDMGFGAQIVDLLQLMPDQRQLMLFSATLEENDVNEFACDHLNEPVLVEIGSARSVPSHIIQKAYFADSLEHKFALLHDILNEGVHAIVFCYSRNRCEEVSEWLQDNDVNCSALHGEMAQKVRNRMVHRFEEGTLPVLVTTDLAARGLHISDVERVVHFDLPRSAEIYVHRSGRTGRNGNEGDSLLLVEGHDARLLGRIERYQQQEVHRDTRPGLEPRHREPEFKRKKKKKAEPASTPKQRKKQRWRDMKNKGKPKGPLGKGKRDS